MKQCIKIKVSGQVQGVNYRKFVQKCAQDLGVEGTIQNMDDKNTVIIYACALSESLDSFIDCLYEGTSGSSIEDVQIEPFIQQKDFRGVFRIIWN